MALNKEKLKNMILFIAKHPSVHDLGTTKLYKLIFFADAAHLRAHGDTISGSDFIKFQHGPVPSRGEKLLKELRKTNDITVSQRMVFNSLLDEITTNTSPDMTVFSDDEKSILDEICKNKGAKTASALSNESHLEPAWVYAKLLDKLSPDLMLYGKEEDPDGL